MSAGSLGYRGAFCNRVRRGMLLYCIRHGQSLYNAQGRVQGHSDVALSELGLRQADAVAEALARLPIEAVYSSPLRRAMQTAEVLAGRLKLELRTDPRLMEINAGVFQDQCRDELERLFPGAYRQWRTGDVDFVIPGGESRRQMVLRGLAAFADIGSSGHTQAAVVTHGAILIGTIKALLGMPADAPPFSLENASVSRIEWDRGTARLIALDDITHLAGVGVSGSGDL